MTAEGEAAAGFTVGDLERFGQRIAAYQQAVVAAPFDGDALADVLDALAAEARALADRVRGTAPGDADPQQLALIVNVKSRWPEVRRGDATPADVVLGDWNLAKRTIDPHRVVYVLGVVDGEIVAAYAVDRPVQVPGYDESRVRFSAGRPLDTLVGRPSPYRWRRGEMYPVVAIPAPEVNALDGEQRAALGGFQLTVTGTRATVVAPAGHEVTIVHPAQRSMLGTV